MTIGYQNFMQFLWWCRRYKFCLLLQRSAKTPLQQLAVIDNRFERKFESKCKKAYKSAWRFKKGYCFTGQFSKEIDNFFKSYESAVVNDLWNNLHRFEYIQNLVHEDGERY